MLHVSDTPHFLQLFAPLPSGYHRVARESGLFVDRVGHLTSHGDLALEQISEITVVHICDGGAGYAEIDGRVFEINPGDACVFFPDHHIRFGDREGEPWSYFWFWIAGQRRHWALEQAGLTENRPHKSGRFDRALKSCNRDALEAYTKEEMVAIYPTLLAYRLIHGLSDSDMHRSDSPEEEASPARRPAESAHLWMNQEYMADLSIDNIAQRLGVDRTTLYRQFRSFYGMSPKQYLMQRRLERASELLTRTRSPIGEIARACGFPNIPYFIRTFGNAYKMPPSAWRERHQKAHPDVNNC